MRLFSIFFLVLVIFVSGCTQIDSIHNTGNECSVDNDCKYLFNSCQEGPELCVPRWGAFCVEGNCELSHNRNLPLNEQWMETCNEHKKRGMDDSILENCFLNSAYASLKKALGDENYTIVWNDAFQTCNDYTIDPERCKLDVCLNLHLGDANFKYIYPEQEQCELEAIKDSSCSDNKRNGRETDIDCGGSDCTQCENTKSCLENKDCKSGVCNTNGIEYRFQCVAICPEGPIKNNAPCGCQTEGYKPQGQEKILVERWEEQYGNGKTLFCCGGVLKQMFPDDNCS